MAGSLYGVFVGAVIVFFTIALPEPLGWAICWSIFAVQLAVGAVVVWRRTGLHAMTCSFVWASGIAAVFAIACSRGMTFEDVLRRDPLLLVASISVAAALMFSERWWHPAAWAQFKRKADDSSVFDILTFRHIPDLRRLRR